MKKYSNSRLNTANECLAKFYWKYKRNLVPAELKAIPLEFGKAIHLAFEYLYKGSSIKEALDIFESYFSKYDGQDGKRTVQLGKDIIKAHHKLYFPEYFKVLLVEKKIEVNLTKDICFTGKADLIVEMDDGIYVIDHKTSSSLNSIIVKPNHQLTGYIWGIRQQENLEVKGAMFNILGVFKGFKAEKHLLRKTTTRDEHDISLWKRWFLTTIERIEKASDTNHYPQESKSCFNYFRACSYKDLCTCNDDCMRERLIEGLFEEKIYD